MSKTTLPATTTKTLESFIDKENGDIKIKYLKGHPRQYRFDASKGNFNINGQTLITQPGKPFTLIPVGYRIFMDRLFEYSNREWLELFFIDDSGAIANVMLHGYSVEEFIRMTQDLFYEDLKITEIEITIIPQEKISKSTGKKYYIAAFDHKQADKKYLDLIKPMTEGIELYRSDTIKPTNEMMIWENYPVERIEESVPIGQSDEAVNAVN